jgi:sulfur carrier protein ThiS
MTAAPRVELRLPAVLKVVVGEDRVAVRGRTLPEALEAAYEALPRLRHHIAAESGELRPHVLCILNGASVPRDEVEKTKLADGDEIWIHQAISGG